MIRPLVLAGAASIALVILPGSTTAGAVASPGFTTVRATPGGFEPRIAVAPDGTRWLSTQDVNSAGTTDLLGAGKEVVYHSSDGRTWQRTASDPSVTNPCCDNEIAISPTGRIFTSVIDFSTININIQYSDDGGRTWTTSLGNTAADQDREWLAVGGKDPVTGMNDVYMLWHNLLSGAADHEMMVSTSRDNGATFGPPVPITPPGTQAWLDLQCADSGGPSNIFTNPRTGQVYAVFGTRSSALGGCGASVTGPFEINIVAATRVWVATSTDQGLTWTDSMAEDDSASGRIVGMQVNAGTVDDKGNVYLVYPESPNPYPDYDGAAVRYRWAPADLSHWSNAVTVAPSGGYGNILTHIAAGDPGQLAFFYLDGHRSAKNIGWYPTVSETWNGLSAAPSFVSKQVSDVPAWQGTATALMGVCDPFGNVPGPLAGLNGGTNGLVCGRSSDVLGQAIDTHCYPTFTWDDDAGASSPATAGTYVVTQTSGPSLCSRTRSVVFSAGETITPPGSAAQTPSSTPNTTGAGPGATVPLLAIGLTTAIGARVRRRRRSA